MSAEFSRAKLLRERGRHEEAVASVLSHLARQPEDPHAFIELALNRMEIPGAVKLALEDARMATGLMPADPFPLALQSRILTQLEKHKEALALAESAIGLDPGFPYAWNAKCLALIGLSRWKDAEECARAALALDADDETASNLLALVLRLQNRLDESEEESGRRLARDPENAFSFANAGWAALQRNQIREAENHFKEALRLDPNMEYARDGLKQAYRARSAFFRVFLRWSFFMQRFNENHRMAIIIGLVVGFKVLRVLFASIHPLLVIPLAFVYYLFVFGSWLSSGLANFLLLKDPVARLSLERGEKAEGVAVGLMFFGGMASGVAGLGLNQMPVALAGGAMVIAAIPASMIFTNPSRLGRSVFGLIGAVILVLGGTMALDVAANPGRGVFEGTAGSCFSGILILAAGTTWLGMVPALRKAKED